MGNPSASPISPWLACEAGRLTTTLPRPAMQQLTLTEYRPSGAVYLTTDELRALRAVAPSVLVEPSTESPGAYHLTPGSWIGVMNLGTIGIEIVPKIELRHVLFLISYAMNPASWSRSGFDFGEERSLVEAIVPGFTAQLRRAMERGPLYGYQSQDDSLSTIKGRPRFGDQLRRRYGTIPPIEVTYDEFTDDIEENRLLKAALSRLGRISVRSRWARRSLHEFDRILGGVAAVEYGRTQLPTIVYTRLNEHYRPAIELAKLIIGNTSFELSHGRVRASAFLVDMNAVFEDFLVVALREALQLSPSVFTQGAAGKRLRLDVEEEVRLAPDLSWWENGHCVFVGDAKYKKTGGIEHPDLYQLLAYVVATGLPGGLLIYAAGEAEPMTRTITRLGRKLAIEVLNLSDNEQQILSEVQRVAVRIKEMKDASAQERTFG
jgi:5-methylcytosine-specific restriction enzyme subunit McrC